MTTNSAWRPSSGIATALPCSRMMQAPQGGSGRQRKSGSEHASRESGKRAVGKGIASASSRPCRWRRARQASRDFVSSDAADNSVAAANWSSALRRAAQELSSYAGLDKVDKLCTSD